MDAIPKQWKQLLKKQKIPNTFVCNSNETPHLKLNTQEYDVFKVKSSGIYWHKTYTEATCIKSWVDRNNVSNDEQFWKAVFNLTNKCVSEHKIKDIQIKIIHRFYPCQSIVSKWDNTISNICKLCNKKPANIIHTLMNVKK